MPMKLNQHDQPAQTVEMKLALSDEQFDEIKGALLDRISETVPQIELPVAGFSDDQFAELQRLLSPISKWAEVKLAEREGGHFAANNPPPVTPVQPVVPIEPVVVPVTPEPMLPAPEDAVDGPPLPPPS